MLKVRFASILLLGLACALAAPTATRKKSATKSSSKKVTAKSKKSSGRKASIPSWRNTQRTPSADRYKEIQQALASKGYLQSSALSGVWDTSSVAALKKFQQDQNLEPSGKLDSLSLIALGLGPRRDQQQPVPSQP